GTAGRGGAAGDLERQRDGAKDLVPLLAPLTGLVEETAEPAEQAGARRRAAPARHPELLVEQGGDGGVGRVAPAGARGDPQDGAVFGRDLGRQLGAQAGLADAGL